MTDRAFAAIVIACVLLLATVVWVTRPQPAQEPGPLRASCDQYGDLVYRQGDRVITVAVGHKECAQ